MERLQAEFGVTVSQQNVNTYRDKHAAQIGEAEQRTYKRVIQVGMTR